MNASSSEILTQGLTVKLEADLDKNFGETIAREAHGEKLFGCIQCGNCSAACPLSVWMDYTPRKVIAMVRAGFKQEVLSNRTVWLCASCYQCTVECPKGIKITDVMYALKREAIENKIYPKNFPVPILARTFYSEVKRTGRINEIFLLTNYYLRYNIFKMLGYASLGVRLFMKRRLSLFEKGMTNRKEFRSMLNQ
ncbi:MAG TPA: 4Fe-4S dicluster domain-containing protein [Bacteroidales bacterium]|nr:4Fe-4S dicluster domain-containing protein [Bacteroidales bacterium]